MSTPIKRRDFVSLCACGAGALLAGCVAMVTHPVPVADGVARIHLADFPDLRKADGAVKLLPDGSSNPIYVVATPAGFVALSPVCTHRGCTVDVQGDHLVCPCHGSTYDRAGRVLRGPAEQPLPSYPVARDGDQLLIRITA